MILVTGGTGKIGAPLVQALVDDGEEVRVMARNTDSRVPGVDNVRGDVREISHVRKAVAGAEMVYHLAGVFDSCPAAVVHEINVLGTKNLLEASGDKRFIYLSSTAVYGSNMKQNPATENTPCNPDGVYGRTKMAAEKLVLWKGGLVLRSAIVYGEGFNAGITPILSRIERGEMRITGSGDNLFQWIHIGDLVQALLLAKDNGKSDVYLVAGGEKRTQRELFSLFAGYLHVPPPKKTTSKGLAATITNYREFVHRIRGQKPEFTHSHLSRITSNRLFDISKAQRELGFKPRVSYDQGAKELVEEYLVHRKG
jgi:nucleoside-diphosphate-sugar epimerase